MICEANISSVSAEPWRRRGEEGGREGALVVGVISEMRVEGEGAGGAGAGRSGSPVMVERCIVAIPHSLHHLQLLLPINPPPLPTPPPKLPPPSLPHPETPQEAGLNH